MALTDKLTNIADAIRTKTGDTALLTLDEMPTAIEAIGGGDIDALIDGSITEITSNAESVVQYALCYREALTTVNFPNATSIGDNALYSCKALTTANFPNATSMGNNVLYSCTNLTTVNFPNVTNIGGYAFQGCTNLTTINFPNVTAISYNAFSGCTNLTTVNFPNVTSISKNTFDGCTVLSTVILRKSDAICTLSNTNAFKSTPIASGTGYIYVPSALIDTYKSATNWSTYANQFRALEDYTVDGTITGALDESKI